MMLNTAYRHGARKYGDGFQRSPLRVRRPANAPIYLVPDTPPTRRIARRAAAKIAGRLVARLIPGIGAVLILMDIKELTEVMRKRRDAVFAPGREEFWDMQGGTQICATGPGTKWAGHSAIITCGAGALHLKSSENQYWYFPGNGWRIVKIPDVTWGLNPLYWDSRTVKIGEQWQHPNGAPDQPPDPVFHPKRPIIVDPFGDPGPAPAPHDKPVPWPDPGEMPDAWPPGWRPPIAPNPPGRRPPDPGKTPRKRPDRRFRDRPRRPENVPDGIPGRETGPKRGQRPKKAEVPLHRPTVIFTPNSPTKISPKPHLRKKPPPRTRQKKVRGLIPAGSWVARGLNGLTEGLDALYAIYDALPDECRESRIGAGGRSGKVGGVGISPVGRRKPKDRFTAAKNVTIKKPPPLEAFQRIAQCLDKLDVSQALWNLALNEIEDFIIGRIAGKAGKALGEQLHIMSPGDFRARSPLAGFGLR